MVRIGRGKLIENTYDQLKELIMIYIEDNADNEVLKMLSDYSNPASLNNIRKKLLETYENKYHVIIPVSNKVLSEIVQDVLELEVSILKNHLIDLTRHNSEFLINLRDSRAEENLQKLANTYKQQHEMTKCGVKRGINFLSDKIIFEIIDEI